MSDPNLLEALEYASPATAAVTTVSGAKVSANAQRGYLCITNLTAEPVFLGVGVAGEDSKGIPLMTIGSSAEFIPGQNMTHDAIYAKTAANTATLAVQEANFASNV